MYIKGTKYLNETPQDEKSNLFDSISRKADVKIV